MEKDVIDAIIWLQRDAAHGYKLVEKYLLNPAHEFIATRVQQAAAHSAALARKLLTGE